ncbi:unnamed protein product [Lactuca saligna]|uniref:Uncharacterized protein n=1 Tax=Lactuca saligna TaxID=75948 RepID=A0AA35YN17_LACSI|nr:unnamed protein product [Lactuca saligna]
MVAAANWVCRSGTNEAYLTTLQDAIGNIKEELHDLEAKCRVLFEQNCIVSCEKSTSEDHVATLEGQTERLKTIESTKFASGIHGIHKACEALGFEKGKRLGGLSIIADESKALDPVHVARRTEEADIDLSSLAKMDFAGHFHLGELDYDNFRQYCPRSGPGGSFLKLGGLICVCAFCSLCKDYDSLRPRVASLHRFCSSSVGDQLLLLHGKYAQPLYFAFA